MIRYQGLLYLQLTSFKNFFKKMIRKPLRFLGYLVMVLNVIFAPFFVRSMIVDNRLDTIPNFVMIVTFANLYVTLPSFLVYLKRKGINFRKRDVNLIFTTPTSPKGILLYAMLKTSMMSIVISLMVGLAGMFVFHVPIHIAIFYILADCIVYNSALLLVGLLMYGQTAISDQTKTMIRRGVKAIIVLIALFIILGIKQTTSSFSWYAVLKSFEKASLSPIIFLVPIVGQGIGMFQFIILGPTLWNTLALIALLVIIVVLACLCYKMADDGDYYEDALTFAEDIDRRVARIENNDGTLFAAKRLKKQSIPMNQAFKNKGSKVIIERQRLEMKRTSRFPLKNLDLLFLAVSTVAGVYAFVNPESFKVDHYFLWVLGATTYVGAFYARKSLWIQEFKNTMFYVIPDSMFHKIMHASLFDFAMCFVRSAVAIIPVSLGLSINLLVIGVAVILSGLIFVMISCSKMVFDRYLSLKIGKGMASIASLIFNLLILSPIGLLLALAAGLGHEWLFCALIGLYTGGVSYGFLRWSARLFANLDTFKA